MCVHDLCVSKLCVRVSKLCVSKLCVSKLCGCVRVGGRQEARGADRSAQSRTRTPHKDVGKKQIQLSPKMTRNNLNKKPN